MTTEPESSTAILSSSLPAQAEERPSPFRTVFVGPSGIRAGWRFLIFVLIFSVLQFIVVQLGLRLIPSFVHLARQAQVGGVMTPQFELVFESALLLVCLSAAWIMSRIESRPLGAYGLPLAGAFGKLFWQGVLWGLAFETVEILVIYALHGYSFGSLALAGPALVKYALAWAMGFILVGLSEEFLFRGYALHTLASGIKFWPAAFILSALFGAAHLSNNGEGWVGALSVFCFGLFGCLALRRTGNLWFIVGFHAAADYAETFIYSTPDSGILATGHLLNSTFHGPKWLTGGTIGPEGSAIAFIVFALAFALFNRVYPPQDHPTASILSTGL